MKILYVFGGIPPYANSLLNKLVDKGVEVVVVIPHKKSTTIGKGVKVTGGENAKYKIITSDEKKSILGKTYFRELPSIIDTEKPDIFVAGWPFFLQYFTQPRLRKSLKDSKTKFVIREIPFQVPPYGKLKSFYSKKFIYDEDMKLLNKQCLFYPKQWLISNFRRFCYSRADGAVVYASVGKNILPSYGIPTERVFVAYNSNNSEELLRIKKELSEEQSALLPNNHRVIHIGRLVKWKRVDLLIDAFAKVLPDFPDAELLIVGGGPEMENLQRRVHDLNIASSVIFTKEIYDNKLIGKYFQASSVYVLAGMGGLSINDAMTFSLPVICSICDGTEHDLVSDGINGFFFRENDVVDLAEKIRILFRNPDLRKKMIFKYYGKQY